jgi:hypothetical protein
MLPPAKQQAPRPLAASIEAQPDGLGVLDLLFDRLVFGEAPLDDGS